MGRSRLRLLLLVSVLGLLGSGLGIGLGLSGAPSGQPAATTARSAPPSTTTSPVPTTTIPGPPTVALPTSYFFDQVSVVNGGLRLSGEVASTASSLTPTCASATVNPQTLAIRSATTANCDDPAFDGETVGVVNSYIPDSNNATISISYQDLATGQVTIGPVVMTYGSYSDTRPVSVYGDGWLWIYDNSVIPASEAADTSISGVAELLQVSTSSGQVVDSVPMPTLYRPLMAANNEGLWIGNSIEGGTCSNCEAPSTLYYVAPGSGAPQVMIPSSTTDVCWLTGNQDVLWLGVTQGLRSGCQDQTILRLDGTNSQPTFQVPEQGYDPFNVIGDESEGLWTVTSTQVVNINPDTGTEHVLTTLPAVVAGPSGGLSAGQAAIFGGSIYILAGYLGFGYSSLVRVSLSA